MKAASDRVCVWLQLPPPEGAVVQFNPGTNAKLSKIQLKHKIMSC